MMSEQTQGSICDRREQSFAKPLFRRIGTAFVNKDQSLNVVLEALPIEGRLHIREPRAHEDKGARARENSPCLRRFNGVAKRG